MGLSNCAKCLKYTMFVFNLIFWLIGLAILGIGLYIRFAPDNPEENSGDEFQLLFNIQFSGAYILIAMGAITTIVGFLGCCGAIRESKCLLILFVIIMLMIFCVLLACGIWAFVVIQVQRDQTKKSLQDLLMEQVRVYPQNPRFMDNLQSALACCGSHSSADYYTYAQVPPKSCGDAILDVVQMGNGCADAVLHKFETSVMFLGGAAIIVAFLLICGIVLGIALVCSIRNADMFA